MKPQNGIFLPMIQLPGQVHMTGGRNLDGSVWISIEGRGQITMPPKQAMEMALGILRTLGITIEEVPAMQEIAHGGQ